MQFLPLSAVGGERDVERSDDRVSKTPMHYTENVRLQINSPDLRCAGSALPFASEK